jgi:hypothetical protein
MDKTLISVDVPNVISIGVILFFVLVLYALLCTYALKWWPESLPSGNAGAQF